MSYVSRKRKYSGSNRRSYKKYKRTAGQSITRYTRNNQKRKMLRRRGKGSYYKKSSTVLIRSKRFKGAPIVKGTPHFSEFYATSQTSLGATNNPITMYIQAFESAQMFPASWLTRNYYANYDAYDQAYPNGYRKIYWRGTKIKLRFTNITESGVTLRICFATPKYGMDSVDWNPDPHRSTNTRHWKIRKMDKFIMTAADFTDIQGIPVANRVTTVVREYWLPANRWIHTKDGHESNAASDFNPAFQNMQTYMFINSDDATDLDNQYVTIDANVTQYWYTSETDSV